MKKKQVALLLAALMCITPVAESAAVMGAEFSSGEETVEMQGTEEEAEAENTAESGHPGKKDQILVQTKRWKWTDLHQKNQRHRQTQQVLNR